DDYFRNHVKPIVRRFKASAPPGAAFILATASLSADSCEGDSTRPSLRRTSTGSSKNCRPNAGSRFRRSSSWPRLYIIASDEKSGTPDAWHLHQLPTPCQVQ